MTFECENCHAKVSCDDALAGRKGRCPSCKFIMTIPGLDVPTLSLAPDEDLKKLFQHFYSKVHGVSFDNQDGASRQKIIAANCRPGLGLFLQTEDDNPVDRYAIKVNLGTGDCIGHIDADLAFALRECIKEGQKLGCMVANVTGGRPGEYLGVNIVIVTGAPATGAHQAQMYVDQYVRPELEAEAAYRYGYQG